MKKVFQLKDEKKKSDRIIEAIKHQLRKYVKRERGKKLPQESDFWDLQCKFGSSIDTAESLPFAQIIKELDTANSNNWEECYVEIVAVPKKQ